MWYGVKGSSASWSFERKRRPRDDDSRAFMSQPRITVTIGRDGKRVCILVLFFALFLVLNFHRYEKDMKLFLGFLLIFFSLCHLLMYLLIYLFIYHENQPLFD
jgi:hypothetical protein